MDVKHWNVLGPPLGNAVQYLGITVNLHLCAVQCLRRTCFKRHKMIQINKHSLVFYSVSYLKKKKRTNKTECVKGRNQSYQFPSVWFSFVKNCFVSPQGSSENAGFCLVWCWLHTKLSYFVFSLLKRVTFFQNNAGLPSITYQLCCKHNFRKLWKIEDYLNIAGIFFLPLSARKDSHMVGFKRDLFIWFQFLFFLSFSVCFQCHKEGCTLPKTTASAGIAFNERAL